ncbi:hypothetical protein [Desulfothermobacter acidiphilus]|uniref:hypothetical protein n=1 Tax=Desulfothermobacter acidiphilus TaxID=1938353 RepID=UPI003F8A37A4
MSKSPSPGRVQVDPEREPGVLFSQKALKVLEFLEACQGAPEGAVRLLFPEHWQRSLRVLRGSGFAKRCWLPGREPFWCPSTARPPTSAREFGERCALGWLAARLKEAGGKLEGREAVFPSGQRFPVALYQPGTRVPGGSLVVSLDGREPKGALLWVAFEELAEKKLQECLRR